MTILTLIPDVNSYGITLLVVWILGYVGVTNFFYARYFSFRKTNIVLVGAIVRSVVVGYGFLLIPIGSIISTEWLSILVSLPVAVLLAFITVKLDRTIIRYYLRRRPRKLNNTPSLADQSDFITASSSDLGLFNKNKSGKRIQKMQSSLNRFSKEPSKKKYGLTAIIVTAITEEILFRGFLVSLCLMINNIPLRFILLGLTAALFALSHLALGWEQVIAKSVLAVVTLVLRLVFQSVLPGIVVHVILNIIAHREAQNDRQVEVTNIAKFKQAWS